MVQADLEAEPLLRGRPMAFRRVDGHALWVSQKVIDESGELPDEVDGGAIIRDDSGTPSGDRIHSLTLNFIS